MEETPLPGGNVNTVTRIGDTVRRIPGPWSATVHGLLLHLEKQGFTGAPHYLGMDGQGREILTYIEGEAGFMDYVWSEAALVEAARMLRRYHDATVGYAPEEAKWQFIYPDSRRHEVICHNDFAPYNVVFRDKLPAGIIDFDTAGPGPRIWDIGYAAYRFVPLSYGDPWLELLLMDMPEQARRINLFCDAYGLEQDQRHKLLPNVEMRLQALCNVLKNGAEAGVPAYRKMVDEGHLAHYRRDLAAFRQHKPELTRLLGL